MLRYSFLPSDFNPMVLLLGDADDLRRLAGVLRRFSANATEIRFEDLEFCASGDDTKIVLKGSGGRPGMRGAPGESSTFQWNLDAAQAEEFARMVEELADPSRRAGSAMLGPEAANESSGIPVKVSRGEFTDDFLVWSEPQAQQRGSHAQG
jgi:hypothetical protein